MKSTSKASGFTLIEILIVIVIIGILSAITSVAVRYAMMTTKASLVGVQINQLSMALDAYKNKYGEYPPDFSDPIAVMRHVKKRWPRSPYTVDPAGYATFILHIAAGSALSSTKSEVLNSEDFDINNPFDNGTCTWDFSGGANYIAAIPFWLGGLPDVAEETGDPKKGNPKGFFSLPTAPLGVMSIGTAIVPVHNLLVESDGNSGIDRKDLAINLLKAQREEMFYTFPTGSVVTNGDVPGFTINEKPLVYFRATSVIAGCGAYALPSDITSTKYYEFPADTELGTATPYARAAAGKWYEEDRFQLIHPGADECFGIPTPNGTGGYDPRSPENYVGMTTEDRDNITNFLTGGNTLEGEIE